MKDDSDCPDPGGAAPSATLRALGERMVAPEISGEAEGEVTSNWMGGDFFLIGRGVLEQGGVRQNRLEIVGNERPAGATEPADAIASRGSTQLAATRWITRTSWTARR